MKQVLLIASVIILSQCTNKLNTNTPTGSEDCICIQIFQPVCGEDGVEYGNSCLAECAEVSYIEGTCPIMTKGKVVDLGDPAIDGCGWVISIDIDGIAVNFRPDNLPTAFQKDGLIVSISYRETMDLSPCGRGSQITIIELISIEEG